MLRSPLSRRPAAYALISSRASACVLSARNPLASIAYTATLARLASSISDRKRGITLGGMTRPSEKNSTLLRPGTSFSALTTAVIAFIVP